MTLPGPRATTGVLGDAEFRAVFRGHPAGVAVITLDLGNRPVGFTATSVISVSAVPPILAFSIDAQSSSWPSVERAGSLVVNFLTAAQVDISARFATSGIDRFRDTDWFRLPGGEPVISGAGAWIRARIEERLVFGGSRLIVLTALEAGAGSDEAPLVYHDKSYHRVDPGTAI